MTGEMSEDVLPLTSERYDLVPRCRFLECPVPPPRLDRLQRMCGKMPNSLNALRVIREPGRITVMFGPGKVTK